MSIRTLSKTSSDFRLLPFINRIVELITSLTRRSVWLTAIAIFTAFPAQLPPDQKLSGEDAKGFADEIARLQILLVSANDKGAVEFQIAKTSAWGGQYQEAMNWLQELSMQI